MKQKRLPVFFLIIFILGLAIACVNLNDIVITSPDLNKIPDGTYQGTSTVGPVKVTLEVLMQNKAITSIQIIKHRNGRGKKAEAIVPRIIEAQSLNVDVISGASYSSKAILLAAENALAGKQ